MGHLARFGGTNPDRRFVFGIWVFFWLASLGPVGSGSQTRSGSECVGNRWARWHVERTSNEEGGKSGFRGETPNIERVWADPETRNGWRQVSSLVRRILRRS